MRKYLLISISAALIIAATTTQKMSAEPKAAFSSTQCKTAVFHSGFDSDEEFSRWTQEGRYGGWRLNSNPYGNGAPAFSSINPESVSSLYFPRVTSQRDEAVVSPEISVEQGDKLSFWSVTNPVWLFAARTQLIICTGEKETVLWDNFMWNQYNPTDDTFWADFEYSLDNFAGENIKLKFLYTGEDGEPVMIDDVTISRTDHSDNAKVITSPGSQVEFVNLTQGEVASYEWSFPGAVPESSVEASPVVAYPAAGIYDVTLKVTTADGKTSSATREGFVVVREKPLEASIGLPEGVYYSPEAGIVVPLLHELTFTDLTKGNVESRSWLFPGTATPNSAETAPTVYYTEPGMYDVDLNVSNSTGNSNAYIYGVKAGQPSLVWNIPARENTDLAPVNLGWYGYYGGTNWLDMPAFAEHFTAPLEPADISEVNVYFAAATISATSADTPLTVSICNSENGLPGKVLASASLPCSDLVDASVTFNDPTTFTFDTPITVSDDFFVTIGEFPNNDGDDIAMYCSPRREDLTNSTVYHLLLDLDENYQPTGTSTWVKNADEALSFAIAPRLEFHLGTAFVALPTDDMIDDGTIDLTQPAEYFTISGQLLPSRPSTPGLYLVRQGSRAAKIIIR